MDGQKQAKKGIGERLSQWLGFYKVSPYVAKFHRDANVRSATYMSLIIVALEIWMLIRYTVKYVIPGMCETFGEYWHYTHSYWIMLAVSIAIFIFSILYEKGKIKQGSMISGVFISIFAATCLFFGMITSLSDFSRGRMITCFLCMVLYVAGIIIWRPYFSILILSASFGGFYYILSHYAYNKAGELVEMTSADLINYVTFFISVTAVAISVYHQRHREAVKTERLEEAAVKDELTGIPNMHHFTEEALGYLLDNQLKGVSCTYIFFNIENFATYNDRKGYKGGNKLLCDMAEIMKEVFPGEPIAREAYDHFVALTKTENLEDKVATVRNRLKEKCPSDKYIDVKAGSYHPKEALADPRLEINHCRYAANLLKHHEDEYLKEYNESLEEGYKLRTYILNNIDKAVKEGYIEVYFQPVVWSLTGELCGCEALARWIDPEKGFLSPGKFIPILEEGRQIHKLDRYVYESVCQKLRASMDAGEKIFPVSLNFSRLDFELMDAVGTLEKLVEEYKIPREYIHVEITESALNENDNKLKDAMDVLHEKGYSLWLDDFGSGYSSLNVLKDYDFDLLKLDMVFLRNFENNDSAKKIIKSILDLAKALNMKTLTEGVESKEAVAFLQESGCGRLQGYLYGKPMVYEEVRKKMEDGEYVLSHDLI